LPIRKHTETKLIGVKYCGGCNPLIDRVKLVGEIQKLLPAKYILTTDTSSAPWNTGIMVCGCATACADKPQIRNLARRWILVAGDSVELNKIPEKELAQIIRDKIIS
jgi:hypothetical protein